MPNRSLPETTVEALRLTLLKLEQTTDSAQGADHLDRLKGRVISRIAELEGANVLESASLEPVVSVDTATAPVAAAPLVDTTASAEESAPKLKLAS